jgi:hypothetical protein
MRVRIGAALAVQLTGGCWAAALCLVLAGTCFATTQHEVFNNAVGFNRSALADMKGLDPDKAMLDNPAAAVLLIQRMKTIQGNCPAATATSCLPDIDPSNPNKQIYVLIHLVRWADYASNTAKTKVQSDHWYLYRDEKPGKWSQEDFTTAKRLLGVRKVYVLYIHFKGSLRDATAGGVSYLPSEIPDYDFTITKKTPANVAHLYALLSAYTGGASAGAAKPAAATRPLPPDAIWGGGILDLQYRPSDILIKSTYRLSSDDSDAKLADDITFDNEGPYWWDVGFAVPVKKITELKLDTTSGTATPAKVNSENVFSVLDLYFRPVDVKESGFTAIPHPIAGVAFAKQPLHKILVGLAWGPKASEFYAGAMFVKQPNLNGNNSCSTLTGTTFTGGGHFCTQFTVGINLSVSAIASKLGAPK